MASDERHHRRSGGEDGRNSDGLIIRPVSAANIAPSQITHGTGVTMLISGATGQRKEIQRSSLKMTTCLKVSFTFRRDSCDQMLMIVNLD
jgi:hypothetical protein